MSRECLQNSKIKLQSSVLEGEQVLSCGHGENGNHCIFIYLLLRAKDNRRDSYPETKLSFIDISSFQILCLHKNHHIYAKIIIFASIISAAYYCHHYFSTEKVVILEFCKTFFFSFFCKKSVGVLNVGISFPKGKVCIPIHRTFNQLYHVECKIVNTY